MKDGLAKITVIGNGELAGDEAIANSAFGKVYTKNGSRYLLYEITDENEAEITVKYLLKLTCNSLKMTKTVQNQKTKIVYKPGKKTEAEYNSPFGTLLLTFDTTTFYITENEDHLLLELKYNIYMDNDIVSRNQLKIEAVSI